MEIQNFDAKFTKWEANVLYNNIINCITTKSPYFNNSFRTKFTQSPKEKWNDQQFFVTKRPWFIPVKLYTNNGSYQEETEEEWLKWRVNDIEVVDWYRYFLIVNKDKTKVRLYKQVEVNNQSIASNETTADIDEWYIVMLKEFPTRPDVEEKFLLTSYVKWKPRYESENWVAKLEKVEDRYFASMLVNNDNEKVNAEWGNYILTLWTVWSGMVHVVWKQLKTDWNFQWWVELATSREPAIAVVWDINRLNNLKYKVFEDYGLTLHFATSDGIVHRHHDEWEPSKCWYSMHGDTYFNTHDNNVNPQNVLYSLNNLNDSTAFLNQKGAVFIWWQWYNKFMYTSLNIIQTNGIYNNMVEHMGWLLLLWPKWVGILLFDFESSQAQLYPLIENSWFFSKYWYWKQDMKFFYVRDTKDFYQMDIQFWYWNQKPAVDLWYRNQFLNTDLEMLDSTDDRVDISFAGNNTYMFLNDDSEHSKILYYDIYHSIRHKRYTKWVKLTWYKHWVFFWQWIYKQWGTTDAGNDITQICTMTFWDQTHSNVKKMMYMKIPLWYNSYITKNTSYRVSALSDWFEQEIVHNKLWTTWYVSNLLKLHENQDVIKNEEFTLRNYPIGIELRNAKGKKFEEASDTLSKEMNEYIDLEVPSQQLEQQDTFTIAKMWSIKVMLWLDWNIFVSELIAKWSDRFEFWWFFLWFTYPDIDSTRTENIVTDWNLTWDSWFTPPTIMNREI